MQSKAKTVDQYLKTLPADRRAAITEIRNVIRTNLPKGFEEGMQYGMIGYFVPHRLYPAGYHCDPKQPLPYICLASQKNYMSLYLCTEYGDEEENEWFQKAWTAAGKKLNMGKSCVRFKKLDDVPLEVVGKAAKRLSVKQYIRIYESIIKSARKVNQRSTKEAANKNTAPQSGRSKAKKQSRSAKKSVVKKQSAMAKKSAKKKSKMTEVNSKRTNGNPELSSSRTGVKRKKPVQKAKAKKSDSLHSSNKKVKPPKKRVKKRRSEAKE